MARPLKHALELGIDITSVHREKSYSSLPGGMPGGRRGGGGGQGLRLEYGVSWDAAL